MQEGRPVTLSTDLEYISNWFFVAYFDKENLQDDLVDNHVYVVDGVCFDQNDEAVVRLRNPWQRNNSSLVNESIPVDSSASLLK